MAVGCGDHDGLTGSAAVVQDVEGLGEQPLEDGWVVAVPAAAADAVWARGRRPARRGAAVRLGPLSRAQVEAAGGAVGGIDDGDFTLDAPAGAHLLCLVQDGGAGEQARGCGDADLPASGRLEVTTGEAGFRVEIR